MESYGFRAIEDSRKELVIKIERELRELEEKVMKALGVGEEEVKEEVGETMNGGDIENVVVEDVHMEHRPL